MITVSEFAKTHNINPKDVLELARDLGYPLKEASDELSDDAKNRLITSLNQHVKRVGLSDLKATSVSSVISGSGRQNITVVTKKRDFKPFDVQALKNKIRTEKQQEAAHQEHVVEAEPMTETAVQEAVIEPIVQVVSESVDSKAVETLSVNPGSNPIAPSSPV